VVVVAGVPHAVSLTGSAFGFVTAGVGASIVVGEAGPGAAEATVVGTGATVVGGYIESVPSSISSSTASVSELAGAADGGSSWSHTSNWSTIPPRPCSRAHEARFCWSGSLGWASTYRTSEPPVTTENRAVAMAVQRRNRRLFIGCGR